MISAISETELLVTSKHSLGTTIVPKETIHPEETETAKVTPAAEPSKTSTKDVPATSTPEPAPTFDLSTKSGQKKAAKHAAQQAKKAVKAKADRDRETYQQQAKVDADAAKQQRGTTGQADSDVPAHAEMGRRWLKKTLRKVGKTERDLAKALWDRNLTAVTEVSVFACRCGYRLTFAT